MLQVDWDNFTLVSGSDVNHEARGEIQGLLTSVRDAVSVWFNVSKHEKCLNITPAINIAPLMAAATDCSKTISKKHGVRRKLRFTLLSGDGDGASVGRAAPLPTEGGLLKLGMRFSASFADKIV